MSDPTPLGLAETYVLSVPDLTQEFEQEVRAKWREEMPGKNLIVLGGGATITPLSHLDAAWREAEAALPEGWDMGITRTTDPVDFDAWAGFSPPDDEDRETWEHRDETGDTPAAALLALAAKLRARP